MSKNKTVEDLKKLRDEIRVKVHLGGLEAKEWWQEIEPQLAALETTLASGVDKASASADLIVQEFAEAFRRVRERLDEPK